MSINTVTITGNVGSVDFNNNVLTMSVAVNDRRKNRQTDQWEDYTNWIRCNVFGRRAGSISPYITKGTKVSISGKLHYSQWTAKDGSKRSAVEVYVDEIEFDNKGGKQPRPGMDVNSIMESAKEVPQSAYDDEDIPF